MKKFIQVFGLVALFALSACTKNEPAAPPADSMENTQAAPDGEANPEASPTPSM